MAYPEYTLNPPENNRILLVTDIHNCHVEWYDTKNEDRMELLCKTLQESHEKQPYDAILCLGDYSLDFWVWDICGSYLWDPPVSRTKEFVEKYRCRFPAPSFMIPGNHEQYGNDTWKEITGTPREFAVVYGDYVFAMCDTFAGDLDPKEHSDGTYTGLNVAFLREVLENHPDKKIMICAHDIYADRESEEAKALIRSNSNILCAFAGHIHQSITLLLDESWGKLPVIYCGDFSYQGKAISDKPHWGYRILNLGDRITTDYICC